VEEAVTLAEWYAELCATPSDIYLHLPRFVQMVEELDAMHVVELGTRSGVSTVAWLHALERTGGRLTSVDLDPAPDIGEWPHWRFIRGDDLDPAVVKACSDPAPDIVFIDTSHHYRHTCQELAVYRWVVKPGGLIVCHDTMLPVPEGAPPGDPRYPVRRAIDEFVKAEGFQWVNVPECWGLGVIKVR
jgi:predicted O-methyltransferase YrrM